DGIRDRNVTGVQTCALPISTGMVELPVDWILDDYPYFVSSGSLPSPELIFKVYQDEFDGAYQEGTMFMLTLHPMVSGHRSRIAYLDKLIAYMKIEIGRAHV